MKNLNIINKIDSIKVNGTNLLIYLQKLNYIIFIFQKYISTLVLTEIKIFFYIL